MTEQSTEAATRMELLRLSAERNAKDLEPSLARWDALSDNARSQVGKDVATKLTDWAKRTTREDIAVHLFAAYGLYAMQLREIAKMEG
ncbi:MAG: hypothetical protein PHU85_18725 [Phycisphaerae bacterium]|nr:hypothetical protein [Phycisphaerae bacterium]